MTKEQKLKELEELLQRKYDIIDSCYNSIRNAQKVLEVLEIKYLKLKSELDSPQPNRDKFKKLQKQLLAIGIDETVIDEMLKRIK